MTVVLVLLKDINQLLMGFQYLLRVSHKVLYICFQQSLCHESHGQLHVYL
jgi:hypothetical protein